MSWNAKIFVWLLILALTPLTGLGEACDERSRGRIVAIGDVHGGYRQFVSILQKAELIDRQNRWSGGCATLVQLGDLIDRGPGDRAVLDLIIELEKTAPPSGGRVLALLGNHEVMVMLGDRRYVSAASYASFAGPKSERRRESAYREYQDYLRSRARYLQRPEPVFTPEDKARWLEQHPPGYFEHVEAFGPRGKYGKWIRKRPALAVLDGTLFLHGGLDPEIQLNAEDINRRVANELEMFDRFADYLIRTETVLPFFDQEEVHRTVREEIDFLEGSSIGDLGHREILRSIIDIGGWLTVHPNGPLWHRDYSTWTEEEGEALTGALLDRYQISEIVVAHTPVLNDGIKFRFGGRIALIDTGLLSEYFTGGRPSALEIKGKERRAIYLDWDM